ncbi:MAG: hypothetical protein Ct9H300mP14_00520 [Gammaproteobacteria bacterium]|nr:MAG: hypothetical protein Ct9H300mP14_00520 [Gammaproteobacteria bacterium]
MLVIFFIGVGVSTVLTGLSTNTIIYLLGCPDWAFFRRSTSGWDCLAGRVRTSAGFDPGVNGAFGHLGSAVAPVFVGFKD